MLARRKVHLARVKDRIGLPVGPLRERDAIQGELIVDNGMGSVMMVDYESWALTGAAYDAVGYCPALKRIIFKVDNSGNEIGYCRYYTVDDLVEKGKAFVGDQTMSEADMATYGLN